MLAHEYHERTLQPWDDKYPESWGLVLEDGTLTNGGLLFSDNCEVYLSRVFCTAEVMKISSVSSTRNPHQRLTD